MTSSKFDQAWEKFWAACETCEADPSEENIQAVFDANAEFIATFPEVE